MQAAQVIEELIELAREMREASERGEHIGLNDDELAFYDALETNDSAVQVLGDDTLRSIARELVGTVRSNVTIDWTSRENVRANLRRLVVGASSASTATHRTSRKRPSAQSSNRRRSFQKAGQTRRELGGKVRLPSYAAALHHPTEQNPERSA